MTHGLVRSVVLAVLFASFIGRAASPQTAVGGASTMGEASTGASKIDAWTSPLRGANYIAYEGHAAEDLPAARDYGIRFLRLFLPGVNGDWPEEEDYFGSDEYARRLAVLDEVIDLAAANGMQVIVAGGTVPGRMYNWNEHGRGDQRLWRAHRYHEEFAAWWRRIAEHYRENPTVVGYELLNEPSFEASRDPERWSHAFLAAFADEVRDTPGDVNLLYRRAVAAIREVDKETPVVLDSGAWASPATFFHLEPIQGDDEVIYSFHWYAPESFTVWRNHRGSVSYPGCVSLEESADEDQVTVSWDIEAQRRFMAAPVQEWQQEHAIPSSRILCGEFSADRRATGANEWNRDVVTVLNENGWHWAYYIFRERGWDAKDFELGPLLQAQTRSDSPMLRVFTEAMRGP